MKGNLLCAGQKARTFQGNLLRNRKFMCRLNTNFLRSPMTENFERVNVNSTQNVVAIVVKHQPQIR